MPTSTNVTKLKINELTEAQYDAAVQQGIIGENEISILTDADVGGLPDQTGNAGKFLTTDGTDASWGTTINPIAIIPVANTYTGVVKLKGYNNNNDILYMNMTPTTGTFELDIRTNTLTRTGWYYFDSAFYPHATMTNLTLGKSTNKWANVYTTKINNGSDITVPNQAGTMVVADSTSATAGQVLTLDSNLQPVWQASSGGVPTLTWYTISTAGNTLTIADTSSAQLVKIYKNGLLLQPTEDYTISGTTLTTVSAMVVGDKITTEVF